MSLSTNVEVKKTTTKVYKPSSAEAFTEIILTNDSAVPMYLNLTGQAAELHKGIRLNAEGGTLVLDDKQSKEIQAISSVENSILAVHVQ